MKNKQLNQSEHFIEDRKQDIDAAEAFLRTNDNLIVNGEIGQGKTSIIRAAAKKLKRKLVEIDVMKFDYKKSVDVELFKQLSLSGQCIFISERLSSWFFKIWAPLVLSTIALLLTGFIPSYLGSNPPPIIWLILIFIIPMAAPFLVWIIFWIWKKIVEKWPRKIILISEINSKKNVDEILPFVWKLKQIYKNNKFVFESSKDIDSIIKSKFNCRELTIGLSKNFDRPINEMIKDMSKKLSHDKGLIRLWDDQVVSINGFEDQFKDLLRHLSYREIKDLAHDFTSLYLQVRGEINLIDYTLAFLVKRYAPRLFRFFEANLDEIIVSNTKSKTDNTNNDADEIVKKFEHFVKETLVPEWLVEALGRFDWIKVENWWWMAKPIPNLEKLRFRFVDVCYYASYLGILNREFLHANMINSFLNKPFNFLTNVVMHKAVPTADVQWDLLGDEECVAFIKQVNQFDDHQMEKILFDEEQGFKKLQVINLTIKAMLGSRLDKTSFIKKLDLVEKHIFITDYFQNFYNDESTLKNSKKLETAVKQILGEDFYNKLPTIGKRINFPMKNAILLDDSNSRLEIFNRNDYLKFLIKNKNKAILKSAHSFKNEQNQWNYIIDGDLPLDTQQELTSFFNQDNTIWALNSAEEWKLLRGSPSEKPNFSIPIKTLIRWLKFREINS